MKARTIIRNQLRKEGKLPIKAAKGEANRRVLYQTFIKNIQGVIVGYNYYHATKDWKLRSVA